ncbi:MAG: hypothetical protein HQL40_19725, partial [Alphaproteobacteria bacterium]|nr:hypothetical protein [Alphaproteobacteria bacterium]
MATDKGWRGIFTKIAEAVGIADEEPVLEPLPGSARDYADEEIRLSLDEFLANEAGRFGTKLYLISLQEFRVAVGDHWRRLEPRAVMISEATIKRHLGRGQNWGRKGAELFVLIFPNMPAEQATDLVTVIAAEIGRRLLGTSRFTGVEPLARVATMSAQDAMAGGALDVDIMTKVMLETGTSVPPSDAPPDMEQPAGRRAAPEDEASGPGELRWHMRPGEHVEADDGPELRRSMMP